MTDDTDQYSPNDIAIVGMALRVPGARNVRAFWENLTNGVESIRDLTEEELLAAGETAERIHHPNYVRRTSELPDMEMFDADFFGLSPKEAAIMDPQHRHFLECAWEALEDAGRPPQPDGTPIGVFAGCGMGSYFYFNVCSNRQLVDQVGMFLLRHTGNDKDFLATRASFAFDLRGPSVNVQTACSTSLVAVHYASQSLLSGECDMAIAGGVTIDLPHRRGYIFHEGEILSPDGHCRAFDHRAAGTVFGSGVGVVVLRRLADALRDGDVIHGVLKGTAINNDGASKAGYLAPSVTGQAEAIIEAQGLAGVEAETVGYVECHGTGTYLGDPIEIEALTQAFRQSTDKTQFCRVGSVKSNIGHLDTAAGVVSLIKATLAVKHGLMPPSLGFEKPNPAIDFMRSPFIVNDTLTPWTPGEGPRRAAVNSLGVGGTNAHAIVEEPPAVVAARRADEPQLFVFAAKHRKALDGATERLGAALAHDPELSTADAAFTLFTGRKHFEHRRVIAARDRAEAIALMGEADTRRSYTHAALEATSGATFLFPGGGAQHVGMARKLYAEDAAFRATVDEGLAALSGEAANAIRDVWFAAPSPAAAAAFLRPSIQLPAILIVEVAIARLWMKWGVKPTALIGPSMGENAAACISGVMSLRDAVNLVRLRGELFDTVEAGGMLSVQMTHEALLSNLPPELDVASVNAPELCVVSGRDADLKTFQDALAEKGVDATRIAIDIAAHSRMLEPILARFEAFLRSIRLNAPTIPIVSNTSGAWLTDAEARDPLYWVRHLRSTVHFAKGMATLAADTTRIYIEVGPGRTLSSLAKAQPGVEANQVFSSLPHPDEDADDRIHFLAALGRAWATGLTVSLEKLWEGSGARRVSLPTYAFLHQRYFIERAAPQAAADNDDGFIPRIAEIADWGYRPTWKQSAPDLLIGAENERASWLIFLDDAGVGTPLVERLRALGHRVRTVSLSDGFARRGADGYALCPEEGRAGYDALISDVMASDEPPTRLVHLWLTTADESFRPGSNFFNRNQERGFYSLLYLAQALSDADAPAGAHLTVVANGMSRVADEKLSYPEKATVLGPAQVIPKEMEMTVRVIDPGADRTTLASASDLLWDDLFGAPSSEIVAYRKGRRWTRTHARLPLADEEKGTAAFRRKGAYFITGGLGDLALVMARDLAERFQARLALVGRSPLPDRADWPMVKLSRPRRDKARRAVEAIEALEALGSEVLYLVADVGNPEDMERAVAETRARFGAINGVLHAAGVVDDDLLQMKGPAETEAVLTPKVHGTAILDRLFKDEKLDLFLLFSSTSTDTAPAGQIDYVAANAYLNAYADAHAGDAGRQTVALHWGVWNEVGLAARATGQDGGGAARVAQDAAGPFFKRWVEDETGTPWLEVEISPRTHWVLDEHRLLSGQAILPGTGYIELIAQAAREHGLTGGVEIEELSFLKPLEVGEAGRTLRLRFDASGKDRRAIVTASNDSGGFDLHAEAFIAEVVGAPSSLDIVALEARSGAPVRAPEGGVLKSAQEDHIRFGARWRVLKSLALGQGEAVARLELPAAFAADLAAGALAHAALLDIATGYAMGLIPGYDRSAVLWAPMSYGRATLHAPLPARVVSHVRFRGDDGYGDGYAAFDVTIADDAGRVVFEAERFVIKRLGDDLGLAAPVAAPRKSDAEASSPAAAQLAAQVRQGITPAEGFRAMLRAIGAGVSQPIVSSMDLDALRRRAERASDAVAAAGDLFERPDLDNEYVAPESEIERKLAAFWTELLGVDKIGVHDSFFDIGGHSLIAVRLFRMIKQAYAVDLPISVLFEAPTIAACARLIEERVGPVEAGAEDGAPAGGAPARSFVHLVPMSPGKNPHATPIFICAGMFGNILNLRQLALHLGADRPVYGLQARGLYGDQAPHETFEEMAADYLAEIRAVQPHGPYLLAGYSGGGLTAFEMARQLNAAGESVDQIVMLDTPVHVEPHLSLLDRASMKWQDLKRDKGAFVRNWLEARRRWAQKKRDVAAGVTSEGVGEQFHNLQIEAAFMRALVKYEVKPYDGAVTLLRPREEPWYVLPDGRKLADGRQLIRDDNGWTPYLSHLTIESTPGDHDSMVLEPFVRVLTQKIRGHLPEPRRRDAPLRQAAE